MSEPTEFFTGTRDLPGDAPHRSDPSEPRSGSAAAVAAPPVTTQEPGGGARAPGRGLSTMLLPELQRLAQSMGITGVGRMRKSQLIEAIQSRQGGPAAGPARSGTASAAPDQSATRGAPAGADAPRHREQDAMEPDRPIQPGQGEGTRAVTSGRGIRAGAEPAAAPSGAPGQLTFAPADASRATAPAAGPASPRAICAGRQRSRSPSGPGNRLRDRSSAEKDPRRRRRHFAVTRSEG